MNLSGDGTPHSERSHVRQPPRGRIVCQLKTNLSGKSSHQTRRTWRMPSLSKKPRSICLKFIVRSRRSRWISLNQANCPVSFSENSELGDCQQPTTLNERKRHDREFLVLFRIVVAITDTWSNSGASFVLTVAQRTSVSSTSQ